jgi:2-keto-4-pentenoate hydratase/2-oxohepta-3-ene-1,7-dioic acid hydratase in catechol pathway
VRIARAQGPDDIVVLARVEGDQLIPLVRAEDGPGRDPLREALTAGIDLAAAPPIGAPMSLSDCRLLSPVSNPQKILCIGLNYADHAAEAGLPTPTSPVLFAKMANALNDPAGEIHCRRDQSSQVDYEVELAVVIGSPVSDVSPELALAHVFGYTVANDVSARDLQLATSQWIRGKTLDGFCPVGPWIVTGDELGDPQSLAIRCHVNGTTVQDGKTSDMVFGVATLVSDLSRHMTLMPGDIILTGTPAGVGHSRTPPLYLLDGDVVEAEIEGIGSIRNTVRVS